ncbi:MAG: GreA/GreB family elongation factor [Planctomycetes bacterium]|nr:GreA/GreB family elongation factor [Planctomycetota bacterium]
MTTIRELLERAERYDFAGLEAGFLEWIEGKSFPAGCGAEAAGLCAKIESAGRKDLAITLASMAFPELPAAEGIPVLTRLARLAPRTPGLATELVERIREVEGNDPSVRAALRASGLGTDETLPGALDRYEEFRSVRVGLYVRHRGDWGTGRVREIDPITGQVVVDFERKRDHRMTLEGVVDLLDRLPDDSWPAQKFDRLEELRSLAEKKPGEVLRRVLDHLGGRGDLEKIRAEIKGSVLPDDRWTRWWAAAKKAAQRDPYLEVKSSGASTTIERREVARTPTDEVRDAMLARTDLAGRWDIARSAERLSGAVEASAVRDPLIEAVVREWEKAKTEDPKILVECLAFLEEQGWEEAGRRLEELAASGDGELLARLTAKDVQRRYARALVTAAPGGGRPALAVALLADGTKMREELVGMLADRANLLAEAETKVLGDPVSYPEAFLDILSGQWKPAFGADEAEVVRVVARFGHDIARLRGIGKATQERYLRRVREYLSADGHRRLRHYLEQRSEDEVRRLASYLRRTEALDELYHGLRVEFEKRLPETTRPEKRFWQDEWLFSTQHGIEKRRTEFRHLMDVQIPENSRAIGEAASRGDLSENAEWSAAIEKQRELTNKSQAWREEIERARPLEEVDIPIDVVAPGTRVALRDLDSGEDVVWAVLGPWDVDVESGVLSYLSPVASGLLGKKVGEEATIVLPDRKHRYGVQGIELYFAAEESPSHVSQQAGKID